MVSKYQYNVKKKQAQSYTGITPLLPSSERPCSIQDTKIPIRR